MKSKNLFFKKVFVGVSIISIFAGISQATNYYVDPATGNMSNDGSEGTPWTTLEDVFDANKTFSGGDTIFLLDGKHGYPTIEGNNSDYVVIMPKSGATPELRKLIVQNATKWVISGLTVSPELYSSYEKGTFVDLKNSASYITLENCNIYSTTDVTGLDSLGFVSKFGIGLQVNSPNSFITNNYIKNTNYAMFVNQSAVNTVVSYNVLSGMLGDGIRGLADDGLYEYNTVKVYYGVNDHHDDGFQSWSGNGGSIEVGEDTVKNITLRGNTFIDRVDVDQPFPPSANDGYGMQGIGLFDGMFENILIENNLIVTDMWHGIAIFGAINCTIINNTSVTNPINETAKTPWVTIQNHKKAKDDPDGYKSYGNLIRNNLVSSLDQAIGATSDNNLVISNYSAHFIDYEGQDFHLKPLSSALGTAKTEAAPTIDLDGTSRTLPYDVGCYEFVSNSSDVIAPSTPTGFDTVEVKLSGIILNWNPSPENDVLGYRIYGAKTYPMPATDSFITLTSLNPLSNYTLTVVAVDSAGNESAQSAGIDVTVPETGSVTSSSAWQSFTFDGVNETDVFTVTFEAFSYNNGIDGVIGILDGTATGYSDLACIIRFAPTGKIDARDAGSYIADKTVGYDAGDIFYFRLVIDVPNNKYDIYVTPPGKDQIKLGQQYDFRSEQAGITSLNSWATFANEGTLQVRNLKFIVDTVSPSIPTGLDTTNVKGSSITLSWDASTDNIAVAGYNVYKVEGADTTKITTVTGTSTDLTGLTKNTQYTFLVNAFDDLDNISGYSDSITLTTKISGIKVTNIDEFNVYPNPVSSTSSFNIKLKNIGRENINIKIYDVSGSIAHKEIVSANQGTVKIKPNLLTKGMYILYVETEHSTYQQKLIVY